MLIHKYSNDDNSLTVEFSNEVLKFMLTECRLSKDLETGGILVGYYNDDLNKAIILKSSRAPIDSKKTKNRFYRGVSGLKKWLSEMWYKERAYYIGEWHFHPFSSSEMSIIDSTQMQSISRDNRINCPEPILFIIGGNPQKKYSTSIYVFTKNIKPLKLNHYESEII